MERDFSHFTLFASILFKFWETCISFKVVKKVRGWEGGREQRREGSGGERDGEEREREGSSF